MMRVTRIIAAFSLILTGGVAWAAPIPAAPAVNANAYLLMDFDSGRVLAALNENDPLEPASITKLMTAYVTFAKMADGTISADDMVTVSEKAWRTGGSRMFIEVGSQVSVTDLLRGMIIQSGNDASVAIAEHVAGGEDTFAELMNQQAAALGMTASNYVNSTGLPDESHFTTARDISLLARALIANFPEGYGYYAEREFTFNGITQHNRNTLLWRDDSVDGLKTGHTDSAGYCLVASAKRGDMRLISVVLGSSSEKTRADASQALLNYGFRFFETHRLYNPQEQVFSARVWKGSEEEAAVGVTRPLYVTIPRGQYDNLEAKMDLRAQIVAPVSRDEELGTLRVLLGKELVTEAPLVAVADVGAGSLWQRMTDTVRLWFE